jgi:hypothetical protein
MLFLTALLSDLKVMMYTVKELRKLNIANVQFSCNDLNTFDSNSYLKPEIEDKN